MYLATVSLLGFMPSSEYQDFSEVLEGFSHEVAGCIAPTDWNRNWKVFCFVTMGAYPDLLDFKFVELNLVGADKQTSNTSVTSRITCALQVKLFVELNDAESRELSVTLTEHQVEQLHRRLQQEYDKVVTVFVQNFVRAAAIKPNQILLESEIRKVTQL